MSKPTVGPPGSRRQAYVSGNHLLSFEVTSSPGGGYGSFGSSTPVRKVRGTRPGTSFTKERFIHANFRFVVREDLVLNRQLYKVDPDAQLEWNDIEMVIVPAQKDVACPICLDSPLSPQLTKCGHFFCWPCILRYSAATSSAGSGNWRKCPICFESINTKQLKSVFFTQVNDFGVSPVEVSEIGIPMTLLMGSLESCLVQQVSQTSSKSPKSLSDLSPFEKITFVSRPFVEGQIIERAARELSAKLNELDENDPDRVYTELAVTMVEDRRIALLSEDLPIPTVSSPPTIPPDSSPVFFHQSIDGQPFFLSPLSIKMLRSEFGNYSEMPTSLCAPVVEIDMAIMTEEIRRRHRYLHHIPIGCQFGLCEVDLSGIVSAQVLKEFATETKSKADQRKHKAAKEAKLLAAAKRREQRQFETSMASFSWEDERSSPSTPGVATGIFGSMDNENFPLPPGVEEASSPSTAIPIEGAEVDGKKKASPPLASSFASVAAVSPGPEGFLIVSGSGQASSSPSKTVDFSSFEDLNQSSESVKKGKRVVLVSNAQRRRS